MNFNQDIIKGNQINSGTLTLQGVIQQDVLFNIPIYQRLYVWGEEQINKLLEDLFKAILDKKDSYYLGAIMLSENVEENSSKHTKIDLVDGQQRFTTLWLICSALYQIQKNQILTDFLYIQNTDKKEPRIHFSIREKAQEYLKNPEIGNRYFDSNMNFIQDLDSEETELIPFIKARNIIVKSIESKENDKENPIENFLEEFIDLIFYKINMTFVYIPSEADLNRIFEAMNNRGEQLKHHELLKSQLLKELNSEYRRKYGIIWDACAKMDGYIERNIKEVASLKWNQIFNEKQILAHKKEEDKQKWYNDLITNKEKILGSKSFDSNSEDGENKPIPLYKILKGEYEKKTDGGGETKKENEESYSSKQIRSIIDFPTFLLHVLRVYQINFHNNIEYDSAVVSPKDLIEIFNDEIKNGGNPNFATDFIDLLWEIRVLFDFFVIKWVFYEDIKEEHQEILRLDINASEDSEKKRISLSISRNEPLLKDLTMLQGMLYHSQEKITQYWLTPFLYYLHFSKYINPNLILQKLEWMENTLFLTESRKDSVLKDRTYRIALDRNSGTNKTINLNKYLTQCLGTSYPSYIFYKLEYILWKERSKIFNIEDLKNNFTDSIKEKWNNYRMTAKNSVEHIYPQNPDEKYIQDFIDVEQIEEFKEIENNKDKRPVDDFGNLVLISPGMNSEYSRKPYGEKREKFKPKKDVDSLKSSLIFFNEKWNWKTVQKHRSLMIKILEEYIEKINNYNL